MLVKTFKKQLNPKLWGENCICLSAKLLLLNIPSHWMPRHNGDLVVFVELWVSRKNNKTPQKPNNSLIMEVITFWFITLLLCFLHSHSSCRV